jgi:hypothetical protein
VWQRSGEAVDTARRRARALRVRMRHGNATTMLDTAEERETLAILTAASRKRFGAIPAETIVAHVLAMTEGADFPVRQAAVDALVRRASFATRDGLAVVGRPARGAVYGEYTTGRGERRDRRAPRPYVTAIEPSPGGPVLGGSCDCADFVRSSLGLCKHMLVVLDALHAERGGLPDREPARPPSRARLVWDPRLPLLGPLDRLAGLRLEAAAGAPLLPAPLRRALDGGGAIAARACGDPHARLDLLTRLHEEILRSRERRLDASPAARRVVVEELARIQRRVRCGAALPRAERELQTLGRKLYPYQRAGVRRLLERGRLLLADDMGLGKTTQAIAACHALFKSRRIKRGLVIAPVSLKHQWLREWEETTRVPARVVDGPPEERRRIYAEHEAGVLIIGYEQLLRDIEAVQAMAPEIVVLDEAQRIKNYATKSALHVKALDPEYRIVLTGTPMENRLEELASIVDWIDDVALSPKWRLVPWHTYDDGDGDGGASGARNLVTLRTRLAEATLRRVRKDVLAQLPARTDTRVPVQMTEQQRGAHDELDRPIASLVSSARRRPLTQPEFLRLMSLLTQQRVISNGLAQLRFEETWPDCSARPASAAVLEGLFAPKLGVFRSLVSDLVLEQDRKVVVFSQWRRMLRLAEWAVRDLLAASGRRSVFFTGAERPAQRTRAVAEFHDDPRAAVMFLSDAGGVGLNLQHAANVCVNLELPWNPAVLEQRIGRIYRLGQEDPIDVYNLVSEEGIESRIARIIGAKQALFAGVFESESNTVAFDGAASFLERIESLVDPGLVVVPAASPAPAAAEVYAAEDDAADEEGGEGDEVEASPEPVAPLLPAAPLAPTDGALASLLASVRVERTATGALRLEAPPHAAQALAQVFDVVAQLLRTSASPPA